MVSSSLFNSIVNDYREKILKEYGDFFYFDVFIDRNGSYPNERDYAKTDGYIVYFSPKILVANRERIEGLLAHEIAHTIFIKMGYEEHSEVETDLLAEYLFNKKIYYDDQLIQTTAYGIRPRPPFLPN